MEGIRRKKRISIGLIVLILAWISGTVKAEEALYVPIAGHVILQGQKGTEEITPDEFTFHISGDGIGRQIIHTDAGGYVDFGGLTLYGEGEYHLEIRQVMEDVDGYTYDISPVQITIQVYRETEGELAYQMEVRKNNVLTDRIQFVNEYKIPEQKELELWTESSSDILTPLSEATHTIHVKNTGQSSLSGIYIREYIPAHTLYRSHTGDGGEYGAIDGREHVTWFFGNLSPDEERTLSLTFRVNECFPSNGTEISRVLFEVVEDGGEIYTNDPQDPVNSRTY